MRTFLLFVLTVATVVAFRLILAESRTAWDDMEREAGARSTATLGAHRIAIEGQTPLDNTKAPEIIREEVRAEALPADESNGAHAPNLATELASLKQSLAQEQERTRYLLALLSTLIQDSTDLRGSPLGMSERYVLEAGKRGNPVSPQDPFVGFLDSLDMRLGRLDISPAQKRNVREQMSYEWSEKVRNVFEETERKLEPLRNLRNTGTPTESADAQAKMAALIRERESSLRYLLPQELWAD